MFTNHTAGAAGSRSRLGGFLVFSLAGLFGSLGSSADAKSLSAHAAPALRATGIASWYDESRFTSTGERYRADTMTAAHPTLPFGTKVSVRNLKNGKSVVVRVNDRGPYKKGRIIDLSRSAAGRLGMLSDGLAPVELRIVSASPRFLSSMSGSSREAVRRGPVPF